jgi:beta-glucosidase
VSAGPREIADVFLPPFEMAVVDGGVRSVMASYNDVDGVPMHSSGEYLTELLRERWGFDGVVVADYFGVAFLSVMHAIAADRGAAAAAALEAGVDIELPSGDAYLEPLAALVRDGEVPVEIVDRAVLRALKQKEELGLLEPGVYEDEPPAVVDLDSPAHRDVALRLAEESVVLLSNDGVLPLGGWHDKPARVAVIGPNADRPEALMGCYSFANHVLAHFPGVPAGFEIPSVAEALGAELGGRGALAPELTFAQGCAVEGDDTSGFGEAVATAEAADVAIVVVGDQAGLFGRGTVGEGNDSESLDLPGVQRELVEAVLATGKPVVMVLLTGRPYAIGWALDGAASGDGAETGAPAGGRKPGAVLQAFFPGEEGGTALAGVISGRVNPSGRLPVSLPRSSGAQPYSYLHPILGGASEVTSTDSTPVRSFGFGLSYTTFERELVAVDPSVEAGGTFRAVVAVTNAGEVAGSDVVQLYGHDVLGSVARPTTQLLGYHRVHLQPGESTTISFEVPTTRFAFSDRRMVRVVEPGDVEVWVGAHAADNVVRVVAEGIADLDEPNDSAPVVPPSARRVVTITGDVHEVTSADDRWVRVTPA